MIMYGSAGNRTRDPLLSSVSLLPLGYRERLIESNTTLREGRGNPILVSKVCNPGRGLPSRGCCKSWTRGWDSRVSPSMWWLIIFSFLPKSVQNMSKTHTRRDFSRLFGVGVLWRHRLITSGMGLSHPPGWDNISTDVKIGGYSFLPLETDLYPNFARLGKCCLILRCLTLGWDNIFAPSFSAKYIMTSRRYQ